MKYCNKCGETKPKIEFSKDLSKKDLLRSACKVCSIIATAKWTSENVERKKETSSIYRNKHKEERKEYFVKYNVINRESHNARSTKWNLDNPDRVRENKAIWRSENPDKCTMYIAKWKELNPEVMRIHRQNRRAREKSNGGKLSKDLAQKLLLLQKGKCACCKKKLNNIYHLDHIIPLLLGGMNIDSNIQLLCPRCNLQKRAKHPIDFMKSKGFLC